jgi:hypothetical protein
MMQGYVVEKSFDSVHAGVIPSCSGQKRLRSFVRVGYPGIVKTWAV